jgi:hypothetical protein
MTDRDPTNTFASCPAATGEAECPDFPDGAHRCGKPRSHVRGDGGSIVHGCTCGTLWISALTKTDPVSDETIAAIMDLP